MKEFIVLFLMFSCIGCAKNDNSEKDSTDNMSTALWSQNFQSSIKLIENLTISGIDEQDRFTFYYMPKITTDDSGNIYVGDNGTATITKFSKKGKFLQKWGKRGQGPGEISEIRVLFFNNTNNELLLYDWHQQRIVSYSSNGAFINLFRIASNKLPFTPYQISNNSKGNFICTGKLGSSPYIIHKFSNQWKHIISFGHYEALNKEFQLYERIGVLGNEYCLLAADGNLFTTKATYDYKIRLFSNEKLMKITKRESPFTEFYKADDLSQKSTGGSIFDRAYGNQKDIKEEEYDWYMSYNSQKYGIKRFSRSFGIYQLNDGSILNFISQGRKDKEKRLVEVYTPNGQFVHCLSVIFNSDKEQKFDIVHKDKFDNFYAFRGEQLKRFQIKR